MDIIKKWESGELVKLPVLDIPPIHRAPENQVDNATAAGLVFQLLGEMRKIKFDYSAYVAEDDPDIKREIWGKFQEDVAKRCKMGHIDFTTPVQPLPGPQLPISEDDLTEKQRVDYMEGKADLLDFVKPKQRNDFLKACDQHAQDEAKRATAFAELQLFAAALRIAQGLDRRGYERYMAEVDFRKIDTFTARKK